MCNNKKLCFRSHMYMGVFGRQVDCKFILMLSLIIGTGNSEMRNLTLILSWNIDAEAGWR